MKLDPATLAHLNSIAPEQYGALFRQLCKQGAIDEAVAMATATPLEAPVLKNMVHLFDSPLDPEEKILACLKRSSLIGGRPVLVKTAIELLEDRYEVTPEASKKEGRATENALARMLNCLEKTGVPIHQPFIKDEEKKDNGGTVDIRSTTWFRWSFSSLSIAGRAVAQGLLTSPDAAFFLLKDRSQTSFPTAAVLTDGKTNNSILRIATLANESDFVSGLINNCGIQEESRMVSINAAINALVTGLRSLKKGINSQFELGPRSMNELEAWQDKVCATFGVLLAGGGTLSPERHEALVDSCVLFYGRGSSFVQSQSLAQALVRCSHLNHEQIVAAVKRLREIGVPLALPGEHENKLLTMAVKKHDPLLYAKLAIELELDDSISQSKTMSPRTVAKKLGDEFYERARALMAQVSINAVVESQRTLDLQPL